MLQFQDNTNHKDFDYGITFEAEGHKVFASAWANEESNYVTRFRVDKIELLPHFPIVVGGGPDSYIELPGWTETRLTRESESTFVSITKSLFAQLAEAGVSLTIEDQSWW